MEKPSLLAGVFRRIRGFFRGRQSSRPVRSRPLVLEHLEDPVVLDKSDKPTGADNQQERLSEIPCRVSSDLHEWHNDWSAVSGSDSANLLFR